MKAQKPKTESKKESSSAFFQRLRPKFLDWRPRTEEEKAQDVKARAEARAAELQRIRELDLAKKAKKNCHRQAQPHRSRQK